MGGIVAPPPTSPPPPSRATCDGTWLAEPGSSTPDVSGICLLPIDGNLQEAVEIAHRLDDAIKEAAGASESLRGGLNRIISSVLSIISGYQDLFIEVCDIATEVAVMDDWSSDFGGSGASDTIWRDGRWETFIARVHEILDELDWTGAGLGDGASCTADLKKRDARKTVTRSHHGKRAFAPVPDLLVSYGFDDPDLWPEWVSILASFLRWTHRISNPYDNNCSGSLGSICCSEACHFSHSGTSGSAGSVACGDGCCGWYCSTFGSSSSSCRNGKRCDEFDDGDLLSYLTLVEGATILGQSQISSQLAALETLKDTWNRMLHSKIAFASGLKRRQLQRHA